MFHFHKYKDVFKKETYTFEGETLTRNAYTSYIICDKCNKAWEEDWSEMGRHKRELTDQETQIIFKKINNNQFYLED